MFKYCEVLAGVLSLHKQNSDFLFISVFVSKIFAKVSVTVCCGKLCIVLVSDEEACKKRLVFLHSLVSIESSQ